ncbi:MAG: hypothetical protein ACRELE_11740, partial [Gemmatimonadales bacterium]
VSIDSLAPDVAPARPSVPVTIPAIPSQAPGTPSRLELAFARRRALSQLPGQPAPTLSGLLGVDVVPIASLMYRGPAALARVDELRAALHLLLADPAVSLESLRPYLHELLDLIPLARDAA